MCGSYGSIAVKRLMTTATLTTENISLELAYNFRVLVHYHHGGECVGMQADMVLEKELRVLHLDLQASGDCVPHWE